MSQVSPQTDRLPTEYWLIIGLGLSASGLFYAAVAAVAWYLLLRKFQPADWECLMVASGLLGIATLRIFQILTRGENPYFVAEHVLFSGAALALVFSQRRGWAWFLLVASAFDAAAWILAAAFEVTKHASARFMVVAGLIDLLWVWLLTRWLRRTRKITVIDAPNDLSTPRP